jgi:hypothetical protein
MATHLQEQCASVVVLCLDQVVDEVLLLLLHVPAAHGAMAQSQQAQLRLDLLGH